MAKTGKKGGSLPMGRLGATGKMFYQFFAGDLIVAIRIVLSKTEMLHCFGYFGSKDPAIPVPVETVEKIIDHIRNFPGGILLF